MTTQTASTMTSDADLVTLDPDHPGFRDEGYRQRRNDIARLALTYREGTPVPTVAYTEAEQEVWRTVWRELGPLIEQKACSAYLASTKLIHIDRTRVPQLAEVNSQLEASSGFSMLPVAGLVSARTFHSFMGRGVFLSTQYMRHPSVPLYTPEPDVVHELVGHATTLGHPLYAALNRAFGLAAERVSEEALTRLGRVYWYTMEFGAVREGGQVKALGAGILSSFGELGRFDREAELRAVDFAEMGARPYDPTRYQDVIYVFDSIEQVEAQVLGYLAAL